MKRKTARAEQPLVDVAEIAEIELVILKRMKEITLGDHGSAFAGPGFNFVGTRDWQPGDRMSAIDWAQSSLTNFSPIVTREFEQNSTATVMAVADASLSTRCGIDDTTIAAAIARSLACIGLSSVLNQDMFGLITFDQDFRQLDAVRPRIGKPQVLHCLDVYEQRPGADRAAVSGDVTATIESHLRKPSFVPVISDFLFADASRVIHELSILNATHDVLVVLVDARAAYRLPPISAGWIEIADVETGQRRTVSRREFSQLHARVEEWQTEIAWLVRDADVDFVSVDPDPWKIKTELTEFFAERRLRKR